MTTHTTLEAARTAAKAKDEMSWILEIDHATEGRCFVVSRVQLATLRNVIAAAKGKALAEIRSLIAEHAVLTASEEKAERERLLRDNTTCERCGVNIDGNTAYSQTEQYRGMNCIAHYCEKCAALLSNIGLGEVTALDERKAGPAIELETKRDV